MNYVEKVLRKEGAWGSLVRQSTRSIHKVMNGMPRDSRQIYVAEAINRCLTWAVTDEGQRYWHNLYKKYYNMSDSEFELLLKTQQIKYNKDLK